MRLFRVYIAEDRERHLVPRLLRPFTEAIGVGGSPRRPTLIAINFGYAGSRDTRLNIGQRLRVGGAIRCDTHPRFVDVLQPHPNALVDMELAHIRRRALFTLSYKTISDHCSYSQYQANTGRLPEVAMLHRREVGSLPSVSP